MRVYWILASTYLLIPQHVVAPGFAPPDSKPQEKEEPLDTELRIEDLHVKARHAATRHREDNDIPLLYSICNALRLGSATVVSRKKGLSVL
jgi:hypothetical protein